jgi:phage head maturation protease/ribosomal protein L40E
MGCHPTKAKALAQLAALNINVKEAAVADTKPCEACKAMNNADADFCDKCGAHMRGTPAPYTPDAEDTMACRCGAMNDPEATFCDQCGAQMNDPNATNPDAGGGGRAFSRPPRDDLVRAMPHGLELRESSGGARPTLVGHFAVFNDWTEINSIFEGRFMEQVAPGSFTKTFAENRAQMRVTFNHGGDPQLGDKVLGPIDVLEEDYHGAHYEVPLFPSVPGLLLDGLREGSYGSSFRFSVMKEDIERSPEASAHNPEALPERTIQEARVMEFGPVTFPAYAGATAGVRSLTDDVLVAKLLSGRDRLTMLLGDKKGDALAQDGAGETHSQSASRKTAVTPTPERRFRSREEFLRWITKT